VWAFCAEGDGVEPVHGDEACGVPGPTIRVNEGDRVKLTFENTHTIPHTVHVHGWHGFEADMSGAEWMGEAMVVPPGEEQTIEWTAKPGGSFIYHCHHQTPTHMEKGMYGAFIVEDPRETDEPDVDKPIVLDEWEHATEGAPGDTRANDLFTINGKSFPLTEPILADPGDHVRLHVVNAGFEFRAMHLHGYTPDSWEGVAGPEHAVPTDVRTVAPGQTVVLDFPADREGLWLFHDHRVTSVTAGASEDGFGAYPRGMLTVLVVGDTYAETLEELAPQLEELGIGDFEDAERAHDHGHGDGPDDASDPAGAGDVVTVEMEDFAFQPERIEVEPGTTVRWVNKDSAMHTVTAEDGSFDSGEVDPSETYERTFDEPGTYAYYCEPHAYQNDDGEYQGMIGEVVVTEEA
jgi:plastocyanin